MASTIRADLGDGFTPRLGEPLQCKQAVNAIQPIAATAISPDQQPSRAQVWSKNLRLDAALAHLWLDLLGKDEHDTCIRAIPHKGKTGTARKGTFAHDLERAQEWQKQGCGLYAVVNHGGNTAAEITACTALFVEWDDRARSEQITLWKVLGLPRPSFQVDTQGKSIHTYWVLNQPASVQLWVDVMDRLITHCGSDPACKGASRVMRLPGSHYIDSTGASRGVVQIINATDVRYSIDDFDALLQPRAESACPEPAPVWHGQKPSTLQEIADALSCIPRRVAGSNSYGEYRNVLWGLISAVEEAGYDREVAIKMMEAHSPSQSCGWNIQQVANSGGEHIHAGSFFYYAKSHGWRRHG